MAVGVVAVVAAVAVPVVAATPPRRSSRRSRPSADQDRSRWDLARIAEGTALLERARAAGAAYRRALELTRQAPQRRFLERRLEQLEG